MRKKKIIILLFAVSFFAGCTPLVQIDWITSNEEIRISPEREELAVTVLTPSQDQVKTITIETSSSFAISPKGIKYQVSATKNQYATDWALKNNSQWASFFVRLHDDKSSSKTIEWENGEWVLYLAFKNTQRGSLESKFKLWTFWYVPFIHGPPN